MGGATNTGWSNNNKLDAEIMRGSIRKVSTQRNGRSNEKYVEWAERLRKIETLLNTGGCRIGEKVTQLREDAI